jgi:hypothetical protein
MTQLSRPLQVALAAAGVLVVVWFVALRGHSSSTEPTTTAPAHSASSSSPSGGAPAAGSNGVYHGSAPGVEGLTRDIQKAHGAAAASERNASQLAQKSAQASGEGSAPASGGTAASGATASSTHSHTASSSTKASRHVPAAAHKTAAHRHAVSGTSGQAWVERQLAHKLTVALLFYSPHAYDDSRTRRELQTLIGRERRSHVKIVLRVAPASEVGSYGQFTRVASIYQTPTVLLVTPAGVVKPPITGLTDGFSIEQAIDEKTQT